MIIRNEDIKELLAEIPDGHRHVRMTIRLDDGTNMTFQEATIANIVRAYIGITTHPQTKKIRFVGKRLGARKEGYADWQLLETGIEEHHE
jgi:hypothetical protein